MTIEEISSISSHDAELPIMRLLKRKATLEVVEETDLDLLHESLMDARECMLRRGSGTSGFSPDDYELLSKDKADRFVDDWLEENSLDIGQSSSNLLSENRRNQFTDLSLKKGMQKGNQHKFGACPYNEGRPLSYFKLVLLSWLENSVRPHAMLVREAS